MSRTKPNIVVTGTPGVGKSSHCEVIAQDTGLRHLSINEFAKEASCRDSWDEERQSWIIDEDKLLDALEKFIPDGGFIIDWHACDLFPEAWIDLVLVLRADSQQLYDRLIARGYGENKLQENLDAEIMGILSEEARESFDSKSVIELNSNSDADLDNNTARITCWVQNWSKIAKD